MALCISYAVEDYDRAEYWMNTETGELLTDAEAHDQFYYDYDGDDPCSVLDFYDMYVPVVDKPKRYVVLH